MQNWYKEDIDVEHVIEHVIMQDALKAFLLLDFFKEGSVQLPSSAWFIKTWTRWESLEIKGSYFVFTIDSKDNDWTRFEHVRTSTGYTPEFHQKRKELLIAEPFFFGVGKANKLW